MRPGVLFLRCEHRFGLIGKQALNFWSQQLAAVDIRCGGIVSGSRPGRKPGCACFLF
jgi:hypothetical protein